MSDIYNREIARVVQTFLTEAGWKYQFNEETGIFSCTISLAGNLNTVRCVLKVNETNYNVYAIAPLSANTNDTKQMQNIAEFICRANFGLRNGNFELDFRDGEIRYKCFVDCNGLLPNEKIVCTSIYCPAAMFERYGEGIIQVLFNEMPPRAAVALCEEETENDVSPQADPEEHAPS